MAVRLGRPLLQDFVRSRQGTVSQEQALKHGRARRINSRPSAGVTATLSFTGTHEIDLIVDRWAHEYNISRSAVIRQAILLADQQWESQRR